MGGDEGGEESLELRMVRSEDKVKELSVLEVGSFLAKHVADRGRDENYLPSPSRSTPVLRYAISLQGDGLQAEQRGSDQFLQQQMGPSFASRKLLAIS